MARWIGRYLLAATRDKGLILKPSGNSFDVYVDSDFSGNWDQREHQMILTQLAQAQVLSLSMLSAHLYGHPNCKCSLHFCQVRLSKLLSAFHSGMPFLSSWNYFVRFKIKGLTSSPLHLVLSIARPLKTTVVHSILQLYTRSDLVPSTSYVKLDSIDSHRFCWHIVCSLGIEILCIFCLYSAEHLCNFVLLSWWFVRYFLKSIKWLCLYLTW